MGVYMGVYKWGQSTSRPNFLSPVDKANLKRKGWKQECYQLEQLFLFLAAPRRAACRILVPQPGIEPGPQQWQRRVLTTGPPGNSQLLTTLDSMWFLVPRESIVQWWLNVPCCSPEVFVPLRKPHHDPFPIFQKKIFTLPMTTASQHRPTTTYHPARPSSSSASHCCGNRPQHPRARHTGSPLYIPAVFISYTLYSLSQGPPPGRTLPGHTASNINMCKKQNHCLFIKSHR